MSKKKTHEEFVNEIKELFPFIDILTKYNGATNDILIKDNRCGHEYTSTPTRIYRKSKCPCCNIYYKNQSENDRHNMFIKRVYDMYGEEYSVIGKYKKSNELIKIKHNTCGNIFEITPNNFLRGRQCPLHRGERISKSRALSYDEVHKRIFDLVGDEYTLLSTNYINAQEKLIFKHNKCGNVFEMLFSNFFYNNQRCPKCNNSKGELKIQEFLDKQSINYEYQKRFDNLVGINNWKLSYDFFIPSKNILIEYQGEQHEHSVECFGGDKTFKRQKEHDKRKREYAKTHNIKLLEIWYYDFKNIETILEKELDIEECVVA